MPQAEAGLAMLGKDILKFIEGHVWKRGHVWKVCAVMYIIYVYVIVKAQEDTHLYHIPHDTLPQYPSPTTITSFLSLSLLLYSPPTCACRLW